MSNRDPSTCCESGFGIFEVIVASGLIVFALLLSINLLVGLAKTRHQIAAKASASAALDNFLTSLRAASGYDDTLRNSLLNGNFPAAFRLNGGKTYEYFDCFSHSDADEVDVVLFSCKRSDGGLIMRTYVVSETVPAPGAVLTPAPTDIIRLPVSTATLAP